ncbi:MAG: toxin-antitoxin system YwqK family antitoxin [Moheibacter sp.]
MKNIIAMKMSKYILLSFIFFLSTILFSQENTIYFDVKWKETSKNKAIYYRPLPLPQLENLSFLRDYYSKNNNLQMQGYYADGIENNYVGDLFWYDENGDESSHAIYINKSQQKKLSYYFDDGKLWKTVEYGDSLKNGKTIEYKPDGSILGESIYKNGHLISGVTGYLHNDSYYYKYNPQTQSQEYVNKPYDDYGKEKKITTIYYWKNTLKTAVERAYKNNKLIYEKNFDEKGNLIQQIDSTSYFNSDIKNGLKNGKYFYYKTIKSGVTNSPEYIEYQSHPFSNVKMPRISHLILYRGAIHFLEKADNAELYREIGYDYFTDNDQPIMRLELDFVLKRAFNPLEKYLDDEAQIIYVSEIQTLSKKELFKKFSKKQWINPYLKNQSITEQIYFASVDFMGKSTTYQTTGKLEKNDTDCALIYIEISPEKYILLRENGGYFIPKKSDDIIEIPNYISK